MPTYEYHCPACNATYDLRQSFSAETTHTCEECGKGIAKRVLHAPPVVFKGSGWYVTDSRGKSSSPVSDRHSSDSSGPGDSDSASSSSNSGSSDAAPSTPTKSSGDTAAAAS
ncbi:MAG TPA: FmdB family zinc ribbon protein [Tepidiformaceae bacterium]|nr:FmdB family zinc ribbon protein [Tepidiformaceae bacterium]